jgi:hypothetical protein
MVMSEPVLRNRLKKKPTPAPEPERPKTDLEVKRDQLIARLEVGDGKLAGVVEGKTSALYRQWEDHWIALLREYEKVEDAIAQGRQR